MKIISTKLNHKYYGLLNACRTISMLNLWDAKTCPVYDMFDLYKPDLIFIDLQNVTQQFINAIQEYNTPLVLFGQGVPHGLCPNTVILSPTTSPILRRNIESDNYTTIYLDNYADVSLFDGHKYDKEFDVGYISVDNERSSQFQQFEFLKQFIGLDCSMRVVGTVRMNIPHYLGFIRHAQMSRFIQAAKIMLDYNHGLLLDIIANGTFCISNVPHKFYSTSYDAMYYLNNYDEAQQMAKKAQLEVLSKDTAYNRLIEIFTSLGMSDNVQRCEQRINEICNLAS